MIPKKTLGILGGMGAVASAKWYENINTILAEKYHVSNDNEYPQMYIHNLSMDGWSEKGIEDENLVRVALIAGIEKMNLLEPDYIVMACNTAHIFFDELQSATSSKIINLIDVCVDHVKEMGYRKTGILSSEVTKKYNLYQNAFEQRDLQYYNPSYSQQHTINMVIKSVLEGKINSGTKKNMRQTINQFVSKHDLDAIVLGCTELPLAVPASDFSVPLVDSGFVLLNKVIELIYS